MRIEMNHERSVTNPLRTALRCCVGGCRMMGLTTLVIASTASATFAAGADEGTRCETRNQLREVARRHFVVDRVTECRSIRMLRDEVKQKAASSAEDFRAVPNDRREDRAEDRAALWSASRSRLGNAQYDRSLRAMRGVFVEKSR